MTKEERQLLIDLGEKVATLAATIRVAPGGDLATLRSTNDLDDLRELQIRYDEWWWQQEEGRKLMEELDGHPV